MINTAGGHEMVVAWFEGGSLDGTEDQLPCVEQALPNDDESLPYKPSEVEHLLFPVSLYVHDGEIYKRLLRDPDGRWHYKRHLGQ